jgi:hypothetical protein
VQSKLEIESHPDHAVKFKTGDPAVIGAVNVTVDAKLHTRLKLESCGLDRLPAVQPVHEMFALVPEVNTEIVAVVGTAEHPPPVQYSNAPESIRALNGRVFPI